jgi:membrane protease YdiL (CAAX protease family)
MKLEPWRVGATALAFLAGLVLGGEIQDAASFAVATVVGVVIAIAGLSASSVCRQLPVRTFTDHGRLLAFSLGAGAALGLINLAANWLIAAMHPAFREVLSQRMATADPIIGLVASPLVEEILFRLFLLSGTTWIVSRLTARRDLAFAVGLLVSSVMFSLVHLDRQMPPDATLANYYRLTLVLKYTVMALPFGWIFWRWGLPYAIAAHVAGNAAHLLAQQDLFR